MKQLSDCESLVKKVKEFADTLQTEEQKEAFIRLAQELVLFVAKL